MENNEIIKDARKELEFLSGDEEERRKAELREKYVIEMNSAKAAGVREGKAQGIQEGKKQAQIENILKLYSKNWSIEEIAEFVELPVEEVKNIIENK